MEARAVEGEDAATPFLAIGATAALIGGVFVIAVALAVLAYVFAG